MVSRTDINFRYGTLAACHSYALCTQNTGTHVYIQIYVAKRIYYILVHLFEIIIVSLDSPDTHV